MKRYKELKFDGNIYTEQYKIDEILINKDFSWFLDCEVENVRLEISYDSKNMMDVLILNSGVFFNGTWIYGVFRNGEWKSGIWEYGVWYNGIWRTGLFKDGLIFNGSFFGGKILNGTIRGGKFYDIEIFPPVIREDTYKPVQNINLVVKPEKIIDNFNKFKNGRRISS